jgi:hypothetical protein
VAHHQRLVLLIAHHAPDRPWLRDRQGPPDYAIYCGEWAVGRIYETRGGPDHLLWFWSLTADPPMAHSDRMPTLEEAKAQFQNSWDAWKVWAKRQEMP